MNFERKKFSNSIPNKTTMSLFKYYGYKPQEVLYHIVKEDHEHFVTYPIELHQVSAYKCKTY